MFSVMTSMSDSSLSSSLSLWALVPMRISSWSRYAVHSVVSVSTLCQNSASSAPSPEVSYALFELKDELVADTFRYGLDHLLLFFRANAHHGIIGGFDNLAINSIGEFCCLGGRNQTNNHQSNAEDCSAAKHGILRQ